MAKFCFNKNNSVQSIGRQHFTIAHELYHLFIQDSPRPHKCVLEDVAKNDIEQCANMFASMLLMPAGGIFQLLPQEEIAAGDVSLASVIRLEHYFSVSRVAILNRLVDLHLLKKNSRDAFVRLSAVQTAREYGYDTTIYMPGNKNLIIGSFGEKARALFDVGYISEGHYIELLNKLNYDTYKNKDNTGC